MTYRADIDGLRAVAVISVLLYHYNLVHVPGGFTGVDVFFVISGFLITRMLVDDIEHGRLSILNFYARRVRRILPALLVMLLVTLALGYVLIDPEDYAKLARSAAFSAFGASNIYFHGNIGYFDRAGEFFPLLHTWSLGVEEQFYLVWPVLLTLAAPIIAGQRRGAILLLVGAFIAASFAAAVLTTATDPRLSFYFPHTRAWELALGALLVFLPRLGRLPGEAANIAGLALIALGIATVSVERNFPGWSALLPCAGAALVIWPKDQNFSARALGTLRGIGLLSYSLYLWHWPVLVLYRIYINSGEPAFAEAVGLVALSFAISWVSLRFIETPARRLAIGNGKTVLAGLASSAAVAGLAGAVIYAEGFTWRLHPSFSPMARRDMWTWTCPYKTIEEYTKGTCAAGAPWETAPIKAVVWGDSQAGVAASIMAPLARESGAAILNYVNCSAVVGIANVYYYRTDNPAYNPDCAEKRSAMVRMLKEHPEINRVVLAASWLVGERLTPDAKAKADHQTAMTVFESALEATVKEISAPGRTVVLLGSVAIWPKDGSFECVYRNPALWRAPCPPEKLVLTKDDRRENAASTAVQARVAQRNPNTVMLRPIDKLCATGTCLHQLDGEPLYMDRSHIRRNLPEPVALKLSRIMGLEAIFR